MRKLSVKMNPRHLATSKTQQLEGKEAVRETTETTHVRETWSWLRKADLNIQTEALTRVGQEKALRTNYMWNTIILTRWQNPPQKKRHDSIANVVHWKLCEKCHLERIKRKKERKKVVWTSAWQFKWNNEVRLLWDRNIQCDQVIEARTDIVVVKNWSGGKCAIIDIALPGDKRISDKKNEKFQNYQDLKEKLQGRGTWELWRQHWSL